LVLKPKIRKIDFGFEICFDTRLTETAMNPTVFSQEDAKIFQSLQTEMIRINNIMAQINNDMDAFNSRRESLNSIFKILTTAIYDNDPSPITKALVDEANKLADM